MINLNILWGWLAIDSIILAQSNTTVLSSTEFWQHLDTCIRIINSEEIIKWEKKVTGTSNISVINEEKVDHIWPTDPLKLKTL